MKKIIILLLIIFGIVLLYKIANRREQITADIEAKLNKTLVRRLDSILTLDQTFRHQIDSVSSKFGENSEELNSLNKKMDETDSSNLIIVKSILDKYGWLGTDVIGPNGNSTLFLVIQHADLKTQEKYLPLMREAVKTGKAKGSDLALLEDRVLLTQGKRQIYGSQVGKLPNSGDYIVFPLDDPDNVDNRRKLVGLTSLAEYLNNWQIKWDVQQYKNDLPDLERQVFGGKKTTR